MDALDIVEAIIVEFTRIQTLPPEQINVGHAFSIPGLIAVNEAGGIYVSHEIDQQISLLASSCMRSDRSIRSKYTQREWIAAIRRAFGPALAEINLEDDLHCNAEKVLRTIRSNVVELKNVGGVRDYVFGTTLFSHPHAKEIRLGSVLIENRNAWLDRVREIGFTTKVTARRLDARWHNRPVRKRKPSLDSINEDSIAGSIGECAYVCSVSVENMGAEAGKQRALTAARLALTAIALLWNTPSKALSGFNLLFDRSLRGKQILMLMPDKRIFCSSSKSHMPHGPWIKPDDWESLHTDKANHFRSFGEIIDHYLNSGTKNTRPRLMSALAQASLWFHEACRETVDTMAIVKFAACLDALSVGGKSGGIKRLINARLGTSDDSVITPDGRTVSKVVDEIYGEGRSRTIHGTNDNLGHDWTEMRELTEQIARWCLLGSVAWVASHTGVDDPKLFSQKI
jgi:hypothetical protein